MSNQIYSDFVIMEILRDLYSVSKEEYEERIEAEFVWQLPYEPIKEFLKPIIMVFNATFGMHETIGFIEYYYKNQNKYEEEYRLSDLKYELTKMILKEEMIRKQFCSSCQALIQDGNAKEYETESTDFMVKVAQEFIDKIEKRDSKVSSQFRLLKECSTEQMLRIMERFEFCEIIL